MIGRHVCPYCGSTYVKTDEEKIECTQCGKDVIMNDPKKETKVTGPEYPKEQEREKAVKNPTQRTFDPRTDKKGEE